MNYHDVDKKDVPKLEFLRKQKWWLTNGCYQVRAKHFFDKANHRLHNPTFCWLSDLSAIYKIVIVVNMSKLYVYIKQMMSTRINNGDKCTIIGIYSGIKWDTYWKIVQWNTLGCNGISDKCHPCWLVAWWGFHHCIYTDRTYIHWHGFHPSNVWGLWGYRYIYIYW